MLVYMFYRTVCCLCGSPLCEKLVLEKYPLKFSPTEEDHEKDEYCDFKYGSCVGCGSLQLMTLVPQHILYDTSHNGTSHSPLWVSHHKEFSRFIEISPTSNVIEVGGAVTISIQNNYKILDFVDNGHPNFIKGNCEDYDFSYTDVIIMSHVFEHLYEPLKFVKNCKKFGVRSIFLSLPMMRADANVICIHNEHTYFADKSDIISLFETNNYILNKTNNFQDHSIFFNFILDLTAVPYHRMITPGRENIILEKFEERRIRLEDVTVTNDNTYIMPAGHFGQMVYYYLKGRKPAGFIDNDLSKQNKRVYGTPLIARSINELNPETVLLYAGSYSEEIRVQINRVHPACNVITLSI